MGLPWHLRRLGNRGPLGTGLATAILLCLALSGCIQFGWDRLSTQVPGAVLNTIQAQSLTTERQALEEIASTNNEDEHSTDVLRRVAQRLARRMAQLGLEEAGQDAFLRPVLLQAIRVDEVKLEIGKHVFTQGRDLALFSRSGEERIQLEAPLVFVGHGVVAPERQRDDYAGLILHDKIALVLAGAADSSYVDTWYSDWRYQCAEAVRRGATGVLLVHPMAQGMDGSGVSGPSVNWSLTRERFTRFQFARRSDATRHARFEAWIPSEAGDELLALVGIDPMQARLAAHSPGFRGRELSLEASLEFTASVTPTTGYNLIGQIPGRYSEEQSILIGASLDGSPQSLRACAALLELAKAFTELAERPARSIVFAIFGAGAWGGREQLGAASYAHDPARELTRAAGALILDGGMRGVKVTVAGDESTASDYMLAAGDTLTAGGTLDSELGAFMAAAASEDEFEFRNEDDLTRWFGSAALAIAREGLPTVTVGCEVEDLRAAMRMAFRVAQTRGNPRWDQNAAFRFFPRR